MRTIFNEWINDIPCQFHEKKNIGILIKAFSRQLQEVQKMFADLYEKTDIDVATGQNLDYVGTIIPLTRKEAGELAGINTAEPVISDERYRMYLRYKLLKNTCECTYYDIMAALDLLWDVSKASYYEREDRPATIFIGLPFVSIDEDDQAKGKPKILKPAGVGFIYSSQYSIAADHSELEQMLLTKVSFFIMIPFWPLRSYDGTFRYDGKTRYDAKRRYELGTALGMHCRIVGFAEQISNLAIETRRNIQYYDGKVRYDGKMKYNALLRKDIVE